MEIQIQINPAKQIQASSNLHDEFNFIAQCSSARDREILLELMNNNIEPKRAPDVIDFIGRSYGIIEKDQRFHKIVQRFFRDVIWKRFQKVVWSDKGTVGVDVPIEPVHVQTFLKVAKLPTTPQYVQNVQRFLSQHAQQL